MKLFAAAVGALAWLVPSAASAAPRPTIVLVHGAFETAAVWQPVAKQLRADGYHVIAVDLPGRDGLPQPDPKRGLEPYRDAVLQAISGSSGKVVLVGHSFGGMTISAVGEAAPERIKTLVYVAAYLPQSGDSLLSLSKRDGSSQMGPAFRVMADKGLASIDPAARGELFCNGCSPALKNHVAAGFVDEPLAPPASPVTLTADRFGKLDKVYIHTAKDIVVSPQLQSAMVAATPVRQEITLQTGHAPFAVAPGALARAIEKAAQ